MGGSAFSFLKNPPFTPRMPPAVYKQVKQSCHAALRELFVYVATPIEGPGKQDHGDVDILVAQEKRCFFPRTASDTVPKSHNELLNEIKLLLAAEYCKITGPAANLAIRWPSSSLEDAEADQGREEKFIQVDVRICKDIDQLCWALFKHAHGDIWNLLGSTIRPFGLTVDEDSLWIRIPEIESFDRKRAKVLLTRDPVEVIHFLGMRVEGFWSEPFGSVEALFEYVTTCRFFWVQEERKEEAEAAAPQAADGGDVGVTGGEEGQRKLKSNDRRRMNQRGIYRRWINEFIPQLREEGRFRRPTGPTESINKPRDAVRDLAFAAFPLVETEYRAKLRAWKLERNVNEAKQLIKDLIPNEEGARQDRIHYRSCLVWGMKKIIMESDPGFDAVPRPEFRDPDGFYDLKVIQDFVKESQEQVGQIAWAIQIARAREANERKELKRKAAEEAAGTPIAAKSEISVHT
ncbi:hypothetical protein QBC42DRAFT_274679 [Cladorrhinum samala]|uniref:Nucleotidyltransferase n=1 Tax=Cladorrhinum samala TaxID=585594 RepID=A0AAV9HHS1_9PEZI|nr:hypothetical protein QBC42DRAFT_274679 [Cladorrhinum samala]